MNKGNPVVVNQTVGQSYEVNRSTHYAQNAKVTENQLQSSEYRPDMSQKRINKSIPYTMEKAVINEIVVEKPIEVVVEKPVPFYKEVEVPYDVIVE